MTETKRNGFTAKKQTFQGVPGYMVKQYRDGLQVMEQFISLKAYKPFFEAIGTQPEYIGEK